MKTIKDVFTGFQNRLAGLYEKQEIEALTLLISEEILTFSKAKIKAFPETTITDEQSTQIENILTELQTGKPVQYILGYTEFYGLKFLVNPSVLIPRPETEELVDWMISSVDSRQLAVGSFQLAVGGGQNYFNILDIGTGSGCIAISLKKSLPMAQVSAIDISVDALQTAKQNAELNNVAINFMHADILNTNHNLQLTTHNSISLIVSNPPYVTLEDMKKMHTNVIDFEPHTALFVPEKDPLIFYKVIADFAANNLINNGLLFFEINESYGSETVQLLEYKGFKNIELRKDLGGKFRMIKGVFNRS